MKLNYRAIVTLLCFGLGVGAHAASPTGTDYRAAAHLELASNYYGLHDYGTALKEINLAIALSKSTQVFNMKGLIHTELQQVEEADRAYKEALSLNRRDADTNNNYGWFLCQNNRVADSYAHFELAVADPMYRTPEKALYNAGRCARLEGATARAQQYFTKALLRRPGAIPVMYELAELQYEAKNYQAAIDVIDRIDTIGGTSARTLWLGLRTEYKLGHANEVESYGTQLLKTFGDSPEATLFLAKTFD
jgi:type IV pilus assembly protein PilF